MNTFKAVLVQWADGNMILRKMSGEYEKEMNVKKTMADNGFEILDYDAVERIKFMDEEEYCEWSDLIAMNDTPAIATLA